MNYLHIRWARFFTLAGWRWKLGSPYSGFDFHVTLLCGNRECEGSHALSVRIREKTREVLMHEHGEMFSVKEMYTAPHPALFGNGPKNTIWQMTHGSGGGEFHVDEWRGEADILWELAAHG